MLLQIFYISCPLNLLLSQNHLAGIIIIYRRLIQRRNNVVRVRVEPGSCDQICRKNDSSMPRKLQGTVCKDLL